MAKPLDDRIAAAMGDGARAATIADLIDEITPTIADAQAEHDRLDALSKSAAASESDAENAADGAAKLSRRIVRLSAKKEQLEERYAQLMNSERRKRAEAEYVQVKARRDTLAAEIEGRWPAITDEIVGLIERIAESDAECERVNRNLYGAEWLLSAEALARDCLGTFHSPAGYILRFRDLKLPKLRGTGLDAMAWPRHVNHFAAQEVQLRADLQRRETEKRHEAEKWKRYVVTPPTNNQIAIPIDTRNGRKTVRYTPDIFVMAPNQVEMAENFGCTVRLARSNESIGQPVGAATI